MAMRFERIETGWCLVEIGRHPPLVVARLENEVELLAIRTFCERYLASPDASPGKFTITSGERAYEVYYLGERGEKITLHLVAADGTRSSIETEFEMA